MYFITPYINQAKDAQAHELDNTAIITHPEKKLYAVKVSKENICPQLKKQYKKKLSKDWGDCK